MTDIQNLTRAYAFAAEQHADQRRKGDRGEPYINHLCEVADRVAQATGGADINLVIAAVLHDVVEDTPVGNDDVAALFGDDVAALVAEVSDDKSLKKADRKIRQIETAAGKSRRAKLIKLADKTSNLRALVDSPPADWDIARRREYLNWARAVVDQLRGANGDLERIFDETAMALERTLLEPGD